MAVARKRSGFVNDTRPYCYPNCNKITIKKEIFPSISQCQSCNYMSTKRGLNLINVYNSSLGMNNSINGNINTKYDYNIRFI
jgi:ribosomal protein L37AE/L43A